MAKLMLMFPGQGSQYVGMGRALFEQNSLAKQAFQDASSCLGFSVEQLCFEGPEETLALTENQQPCILTLSIAILRVLWDNHRFDPDLVAGHSLGEYSALVASGRLAFSDALKLVRARGLAMQSAVPQGLGAMAAVLGYEEEAIKELCEKISTPQERIEVVNFNSPVQQIISGHKTAVDLACLKLKELGVTTKALPVSAPFHSSLMAPARERMTPLINQSSFHSSLIPIIPNISGEVRESYEPSYLIEQIDKPVLWTKTIASAEAFGVERYLEVGPGRVLFGLARRLVPKTRKIEHTEDLSVLAF